MISDSRGDRAYFAGGDILGFGDVIDMVKVA